MTIFLNQNLKDEWTLKAPELQKMNSRGTLLCNLITAVTSPAKLRAVAKSGMLLYNQISLTFQEFLKPLRRKLKLFHPWISILNIMAEYSEYYKTFSHVSSDRCLLGFSFKLSSCCSNSAHILIVLLCQNNVKVC